MKKPFEKRPVFRSMMRPYKPLGAEHQDSENQHIYRHQLPGTEMPQDRHFKYSIVLLEYDAPEGVDDLPLEEKSSCHASVSKTKDGHPVVVAYIILVRSAFSHTNVQQLTERLQCFAHELLYATQYPRLVDIYDGRLSSETLENEIREPDTDEEDDLVCSFCTVAKFLDSIHLLTGIPAHKDKKKWKEYSGTEAGAKRFRSHWEEERGLAKEIVSGKITGYFERGYGIHPLPILAECRTFCSNYHTGKCTNSTSNVQECPGCPHFHTFASHFAKIGNHYGCDREFAAYLCKRPDKH